MQAPISRLPASMALVLVALTLKAFADPIPVRHFQGSSRGFLVLKDITGHRIAYGDFTQTVQAERVTSRLTFRFRDGSLDDDTTIYTQHRTFKLISDHHTQQGPSFPKPLDTLIDAASGTVTSRYKDKDGVEKIDRQSLSMPSDVSNGMALTVIGDLGFQAPVTRLAYVASSTTKSRLVHLAISPIGRTPFTVGGSRRRAVELVVRVELGGITGAIAPLIGKQPDDIHVWVLDGAVPLVLATEGQFYEGGPVWRVELISPTWPSPAIVR